MSKLETIKVSGGEYAKVPTRLKAFREENPRAKISSKPYWHEDGSLDFHTTIIKDRSDPNSPMGDGWAHYSALELKQPKSFEKLQTISKGRALADVGYLNDGEIATTEELEEFNDYRERKKQFELEKSAKLLRNAKSLDELKNAFMSLSGTHKAELIDIKDEMKKKIGAKNAGTKPTTK